jgi:hypothetical protein
MGAGSRERPAVTNTQSTLSTEPSNELLTTEVERRRGDLGDLRSE